jgi:hypothetical protein
MMTRKMKIARLLKRLMKRAVPEVKAVPWVVEKRRESKRSRKSRNPPSVPPPGRGMPGHQVNFSRFSLFFKYA